MLQQVKDLKIIGIEIKINELSIYKDKYDKLMIDNINKCKKNYKLRKALNIIRLKKVITCKTEYYYVAFHRVIILH